MLRLEHMDDGRTHFQFELMNRVKGTRKVNSKYDSGFRTKVSRD